MGGARVCGLQVVIERLHIGAIQVPVSVVWCGDTFAACDDATMIFTCWGGDYQQGWVAVLSSCVVGLFFVGGRVVDWVM